MSGEWNWLCKTHLNEAEDGGCVKEKEPSKMWYYWFCTRVANPVSQPDFPGERKSGGMK